MAKQLKNQADIDAANAAWADWERTRDDEKAAWARVTCLDNDPPADPREYSDAFDHATFLTKMERVVWWEAVAAMRKAYPASQPTPTVRPDWPHGIYNGRAVVRVPR